MTYLSKRYTESLKVTGTFANAEVLPLTFCKDKRSIKHKEAYTSLYAFDTEEIKIHVQKNKTIRGFTGNLHSSELLIDIDDSDLEKALLRTSKIIQYFKLVYSIDYSNIQVWFSGNKGFHIILPDKLFGGFEKNLNKQNLIQKILLSYLLDEKEYDISIYNHTRLIRLPYSKHPVTGLYKKDIPINIILNGEINPIKEYCKEIKEEDILLEDNDFRDVNDEHLKDLYVKALDEIKNTSMQPQQTFSQNIIAPAKRKKCIYKLMIGANVGERHQYAMRIANYFYKEGLGDLTYGILSKWNSKLSNPLSETHINTIIRDSGRYDYGCKDRILSKYCDTSCHIYKLISNEKEILSMTEAQNEYKQYIDNLDSNKIDLSEWLPITDYTRGFIRGEVIVLMAGTGNGKTAFIQNLCMVKRTPTIIFSLELSTPMIYQRMIQIGENKTIEWVENKYKNGFTISELKYNHIYIVSKIMTLEDMKNIVQMIKDKYNIEIQQVVIDYLSLIKSNIKNPYERTSTIARELKEFAKETNTVTYILSQTSRADPDGKQRLTLASGRDSGAIEEVADTLIGFWRPDKDREEETPIEEMYLELLKNRKGPSGIIIKTLFKKETLRIGKMQYIKEGEEYNDK